MRFWRLWPLPVSLVAFLLNVELVVMPLLIWCDITGPLFYIIAMSAATIEICWWYYFFGWSGRSMTQWHAIEHARRYLSDRGMHNVVLRTGENIRKSALWVWQELSDFVQHHTMPRYQWQMRLLNASLTIVRTSPLWLGYGVIFGMGAAPVGWVVGIPLCRASKLRYDFLALMLGNIAKIAYLGVGVLAAARQLGFIAS